MSTFSRQVRKAAQQGVCGILRGSDFLFTDNAPTHHPAAVTTAKFCIKEMEHAGGKTTWSDLTDLLFFLGLRWGYVMMLGSTKLWSVFFLQAAKKTPPRFICWVSWRNWWGRFLWELSSLVVRLCCEWWRSAMWWEHSQIIWIILFLLLFLSFIQLYCYSNAVFNIASVFLAVASDGERNAGLS